MDNIKLCVRPTPCVSLIRRTMDGGLMSFDIILVDHAWCTPIIQYVHISIIVKLYIIILFKISKSTLLLCMVGDFRIPTTIAS